MLTFRQFLLLLSITFFTINDADSKQPRIKLIITVFIHGAINLGPFAPVTHFDLFISDKVPGSLYEKIIQNIRQDSFFFENQAMGERGFHQIDFEGIAPGQAAKAFASIFDKLTKENNDQTLRRYYTFGWDGTFSKKRRQGHAKELYEALLVECAMIKKQGFDPVIEIVGYCHGAQLTLELATVAKEYSLDDHNLPLKIHKSIFIGMPVSPDAVLCIASPIFDKVFIIFSCHDRVQPIDVFVGGQLWNGRAIVTNDPIIQKKLLQIDLRIHEQFGSREMENPDFSDSKNSLASRISWRNRSPGHIELWFFNWTPNNYRENWILKPFPAAVFLPLVLQHAQEVCENFSKKLPLIVDIRPNARKILIRQTGSPLVIQKSWLSEPFIKKLEKIATSAHPARKKSKEEYKARINYHVESTSEREFQQSMSSVTL